jgi:hypothetical protein
VSTTLAIVLRIARLTQLDIIPAEVIDFPIAITR